MKYSKDTLIKLRPTQIECLEHDADQTMLDLSNSIRLYKSSPEGFTLQLRTYGSIVPFNHKAKRRMMVTTADYLDVNVIDDLIEQLILIRKDIIGEHNGR